MAEGFIDTAVSMKDQRPVFSEQPEPFDTSQGKKDIFFFSLLGVLNLEIAAWEIVCYDPERRSCFCREILPISGIFKVCMLGHGLMRTFCSKENKGQVELALH